jgi:hypothetical protein
MTMNVTTFIVSIYFEMLPPRTMTISNDNKHSNTHCRQMFFTFCLQRMITLLLVLCLAFATQLVVVFFFSSYAIDGNEFIFLATYERVENEPKIKIILCCLCFC